MTSSKEDPRSIGVFDSGIGGLTVLKVLAERFPEESFLYLGDTARLPYGSKSPQTIRRYSEQNLRYLLKQGVKAVVIA
ncbi:MAG: glutamate racemase, partial [Pseudobdellovibrionaceae bacterium]